MKEIKSRAIETVYKGYRFRSRLEARWAVFLDSFDEEWDYEKEGYVLASGCYLPDFFLPRLGCWLEIKGLRPSEKETLLAYELAHATDKAVVLAWGLPQAVPQNQKDKRSAINFKNNRLMVFCCDTTDSGGGENWWDESFLAIDLEDKLCICSNNNFGSRDFCTPEWNDFPGMRLVRHIKRSVSDLDVNIAKSARFEFQT